MEANSVVQVTWSRVLLEWKAGSEALECYWGFQCHELAKEFTEMSK
jgi:hypothetical protein